MKKLDLKVDNEIEHVIDNAINQISAELRTISVDVKYSFTLSTYEFSDLIFFQI